MRFRLPTPFVAFGALVALLSAAPGFSTTIKPLQFDEVVRESTIVVEGTVIDVRAQWTGPDLLTRKSKTHVAPGSPSSRVKDEKQGDGPTTPRSAGVEGGRMLVTEVTLAVQSQVVGDAPSTVRFRVAGGKDGRRTVTVFGMPTFEIGNKYIVFLRSDFATSRAPIVGVNQGYFEVVQSDNREILLNADGDIVIGVEEDQVRLQHNPARSAGPTRQMAAAPVPEAGSNVQSRLSPRVQRYWSSTQTPMSRESFFAKVRAAKGGTP